MRPSGIPAALLALALAGLCDCSFLFDAGSLDNPGAAGPEAGPPGSDDGGGDDGTTDDSPAGDDGPVGTMDSAGGGDDGGSGPDTRSGDEGGRDAADGGGGGPSDAADGGGGDDGSGDAGPAPEAGPPDAGNEGGPDSAVESGPTDAADGGSVDLTTGLVAYYTFSESSGTTTADSSGNGNTANVLGGATFTAGVQGNAITLSGTNQYVAMPSGILNGLSSVSISTWANLTAADLSTTKHWCRIFDFGVANPDGGQPATYLFLTPNPSTGSGLRFSISTSGNGGEQQLNAGPPTAGTWQHYVVTLTAGAGVLYVGGSPVTTSTIFTMTPATIGTLTQNWMGRSQFTADPYLIGQIDNFRIYNRVLTATEVTELFTQQL